MIHPQAHVSNDCQIGHGTRIWQFATVIMGTVIGEDCNIGACAVLSGPHIGNRTKISSGVVMGPGFKIGNDVFIGPNVVLANDMWPDADADGYDDAALRSGKYAVVVEDGAIIGANAVVLPGVRIGRGAVVAAGSVCERNVPDGMVWRRNGYISQRPPDWRQKRMRWAAVAANETQVPMVAVGDPRQCPSCLGADQHIDGCELSGKEHAYVNEGWPPVNFMDTTSPMKHER